MELLLSLDDVTSANSASEWHLTVSSILSLQEGTFLPFVV